LKQKQYRALEDVLHHENYTVTGLSTGNDKVEDTCKGLQEYLDASNKTAQVERLELDRHLQEVLDAQTAIDTHPCPCIWGQWEEWSKCSTTCEAGLQYRERVIETPAINNGTECSGSSEENEGCNKNVCCPVNCEWAEWEEWDSCPSGCPPQEKTRIRRKWMFASCNGLECEGEDFEEMSCSREVELAERVAELESDVEKCQETGQTELNTAHQDTGTLLTTAPKDTGTKLTTAPKDTGTEQKTANQANQGIIKIFYTTGDGMKGETVESSGNCLMSCNFKAGPCPGYCGENGYCLVTGLTLMGDMFYTCVVWKTKVTKVAPLMG